jgi:formate hydrogenlyase transcriptional activator
MIVATHRDLTEMIQTKAFREDLFYRLNVFPIELPPLRERREDIPLLVDYFVSQVCQRMQKTIPSISKQTMQALIDNPWKGNVRELANVIERAVILTRGDELELRTSSETRVAVSPHATFRSAECKAIIEALRAASGRISGVGGAAERLGLKRTTLQNKMRRLGIARTQCQ